MKITLVGAGPVGSLLALMLARRGFEVQCFERRPDLRRADISAGRSINLAVSTRGLHALHQVGLEQEVLRQAVPMLGRRMHAVDGAETFLRYGKDDREFINSMSRGGLNKMLMTAAEESGRVRIEFQQRLVGWDAATRTARFRDEVSGEVREVHADVLIGTDGSASALRAGMVEAGAARASSEVLDAGYKELNLPPLPGGLQGRFALEPHALHIWPRGSFMMIALTNPDGSFTCTLFLAFVSQGGAQPSFAQLRTEADAQAFLQRYFPDLLRLLPDAPAQLIAAPLGQMVTVRCTPWSQDRALLLGDAAHAIVPFFGQGMNSGFEDCTLLDAALDRAGPRPDWAHLFAEFGAARKPDADAIAALALENFVEMRDKVADPRFLLQRAVEAELQKRHPDAYWSRYRLVTFSRVPYSVALEAGRIQGELLDEVTRGKNALADVDVGLADRLAQERLFPYLRAHGLSA